MVARWFFAGAATTATSTVRGTAAAGPGVGRCALKRRQDVPTFAEAVETVIAIHREGWKNAGKSEKQWRASLRDYAMRLIVNDDPLSGLASRGVVVETGHMAR